MEKDALLLLHGALGAKSQFAPLRTLLEEAFDLHVMDFEGHGDSPMEGEHFSTESFAENLLDYLALHDLDRAHLFGYSMGGYVALLFASQHPQRVGQIFTLATKFDWSPETAAREMRYLDPEQLLHKVPHFAQQLEARHSAFGWRNVLRETGTMMQGLGDNPPITPALLQGIPHRCRIALGDRDAMVTLDESVRAYRQLPQGELEILPATPHPLEKLPLARLAYSLREFFGAELS